jgi:hypothetical protein
VHEHALPALAATSAPIAKRHFISFAQDDFPFFTGSAAPFVLVVSLHAALLYGFAAGLGP